MMPGVMDGRVVESYQRTLKRSGSGSPMMIRVARVREEVEYAVEESRTPGEDK